MDFIELFEEGYGCGVLGSFLYGICIGLVKFLGETETSDMVMTVCRFLATILFKISLVQIIVKNCNSKKECITALIKLFLSTAIIYLVISRIVGAIITFGFIYVILSIIFSTVVVVVIII